MKKKTEQEGKKQKLDYVSPGDCFTYIFHFTASILHSLLLNVHYFLHRFYHTCNIWQACLN